MSPQERHIAIRSDTDIVEARQAARSLAEQVGFAGTDLVLIATAVSEVARNIVKYAHSGEVVLCVVKQGNRLGLSAIAQDDGPGIPDVAKAMELRYSTGGGLGMGLPGARRVADEFEISSSVGGGTAVKMKKWLR